MKGNDEDKEERIKAQKEAQKRFEEKRAADKAAKLKELADEKERQCSRLLSPRSEHG